LDSFKRIKKRNNIMIRKIEVIPLGIAPSFRRKIARGTLEPGNPAAMKGKPVLVRITSDEGQIGNGEVRVIQPFHGETTMSVVAAIRDFYAPLMIGKDPFDLESFWAEFDAALPGNPNARAPVDYALYDLMGKMLGVPVYKLLGGRFCDKIPLEWSVGLNSLDQMVAEATGSREKYGIKVFCLKVGPGDRWQEDVRTFKAMRKALGDEVTLGIDANETYTVPVAVKAIRQMEEFDLGYAEQPVAASDLEGMRRVRMATHTPIVADESAFSLQDAFRILKMEAADVICVKTFKPGGLCNSKKIASLAESCSAKVNVGGTAHGARMEAAVGAHFYAATRNVFPAGEFVMGITEEDPLVDNPFTIKDGCIYVPETPGLGLEIDEDALKKYALSIDTVE
jgi:L-alanine-DL-glutamate epimerase-like enolase superfamily enzyme